jgi:hypothetical protein
MTRRKRRKVAPASELLLLFIASRASVSAMLSNMDSLTSRSLVEIVISGTEQR